MTTITGISWADRTWGPILGCEKVTSGCRTCYAIVDAWRWSHLKNEKISGTFEGLVEKDATTGALDWTGMIRLLPQRLADPLSIRAPQRIFVNSMSDVFHADVPLDYIVNIWAVMAATQRHTYLILTKRHARMASVLRRPMFRDAVMACATEKWGMNADIAAAMPWPLENVHLGVSVEDQATADMRLPALLDPDVPAVVKWASCEPLLAPVDLGAYVVERPMWGPVYAEPTSPAGLLVQDLQLRHRLDWIVVGGESGKDARPMHPNWVRRLRDQAVTAKVAFYLKQWGAWGPAPWALPICDPAIGWTGTKAELAAAKAGAVARGATHSYAEWAHQHDHEVIPAGNKPWSGERGTLPPTHAAIRRWGVKPAGRELDGVVWDEFPVADEKRLVGVGR